VTAPALLIYLLRHSTGNLFAVWGEDESEPTGPIAFATVAEAQRFKTETPGARSLDVVSMARDQLLSLAKARGWTQLWTRSVPDEWGKHTWFAAAIAGTPGTSHDHPQPPHH
jgi:hypothetical protein